MATYALTGNDDLFLNLRSFKDFSDNSTISITFPNEKVGVSTGKTVILPMQQIRRVKTYRWSLGLLRGQRMTNGLTV